MATHEEPLPKWLEEELGRTKLRERELFLQKPDKRDPSEGGQTEMPYYWKQVSYNLYVLVPPNGEKPLTFDSYEGLRAYCGRRGINAKQA